MTARMARDVDDLSGGRLTLGMGAGWQEREHNCFGYALLDVPQRFARFQEALQVVTRLLRSNEPVSFEASITSCARPACCPGHSGLAALAS